ncbi:hypothetical protein LHJ74_19895 [Streptomyces sp. N2-109]|uniref:Lipoprotein n=1 Tax=Streptomyces gossypii TaxID=2883101 RepID=A0ABT2JW53_9ACTN|nr:hypothetical protein [Streptomyces gossypii]MCT2592138.1 hypothetical protein [Streptomyces gossypii]
MAAALAAATMLLSGCGSDDDGGGDESASKDSASESPAGGGEEAPDKPATEEVTAMTMQGGWTTEALHADKGLLILVVAEQKAVVTGKSTCTGDVVDNSQPATLDLTCADGSTDYAKGTVDSLVGEKLSITWESGKKSVFTKTDADPGSLPDPNGPPDLG